MTDADGQRPASSGTDLPPLSQLHDVLRHGRFAVTAEIGPPRSATLEPIRRKARLLRGWVDAANVTDNQSAVARLASWAGCLALMQEGLEPVMQLQCRDRNRIALQTDLLGAGAFGIPNVALMTGDHQRFGDHPDARGVFDLDSVQLLWTARTMRDARRLLSGRELQVPPRWLIGAVENPFAPPRAYRAERLGKKVAAGAQFVQTQLTFDLPAFAAWMAAVRDLGLDRRCFVLAGVGPIKSLRALEHMRHAVPGVHVPDEVVERLGGVPEDRVAAEGLALCVEVIQRLREIPGLAGVHVMAVGWEEAVPEILERAGLGRRDGAAEPAAVGGGLP
ncbi:MAG TPA: methylenetetrahydrofolate reductase [Chloroflexota bacterium]